MKNKYYLTIIFLLIITATIKSQTPPQPFYLVRFFYVQGYDMVFNMEAADINRDGHIDMVIGNANSTNVYYGGSGILDTAADVKYRGRCLAVCDYNGDGFKDLVTMEFDSLDTLAGYWNTNLLFYYGSDTSQIEIDTTVDYTVPFPKLKVSDYYLGSTLVHYGDFNGDGKSDIVISSPQYYNLDNGSRGIIYIYMGSEIPPDTPSFHVEGKKTIPSKEYTLDYGLYFNIGDINGDGYDDLLISERRAINLSDISNSYFEYPILYIYKGESNFTFYADSESVKYESRFSTGWFQEYFSVADVNDDGTSDLFAGGGKTTGIHYGSSNGIDTIPSFILADPDTDRHDFGGNSILFNIGDYNKDSYNDFIMAGSDFTLHLGGPYVSSYNTYGIAGLPGIFGYPDKAIPVGDQNGDGINDFAVCEINYLSDISVYYGYLVIYKGRDDVHTDVDETDHSKVKDFKLYQNYPNPFNPTTVIGYRLPESGKVAVKVYDLRGKEITTLINQQQTGGRYEIEFNAEKYKLSSGVYFYQLIVTTGNGEYKTEKKMMVLK